MVQNCPSLRILSFRDIDGIATVPENIRIPPQLKRLEIEGYVLEAANNPPFWKACTPWVQELVVIITSPSQLESLAWLDGIAAIGPHLRQLIFRDADLNVTTNSDVHQLMLLSFPNLDTMDIDISLNFTFPDALFPRMRKMDAALIRKTQRNLLAFAGSVMGCIRSILRAVDQKQLPVLETFSISLERRDLRRIRSLLGMLGADEFAQSEFMQSESTFVRYDRMWTSGDCQATAMSRLTFTPRKCEEVR